MKLKDLDLSMVTEAVGVYLDVAYASGGAPRVMPDLSLPDDPSPEQILALFQKEAVEEEHCPVRVRYTMRLGNRNYPFMKLLLQEHIVAGEFFFGVDTHDDMTIKPDYPDYDAWMAVRKFNGELKRAIEAAFCEHGLSTASSLRELIASRCGAEVCERSGSILVVDDEEDLADAVETLLRARGYQMFKVYDGRSAIEKAQELRPDLILLDYELPEMDGLEVIAALRDSERTKDIPVLLCTASKISVGDIRKADGFLAKPYQEDLLYQMVQRVMTAAEREREGEG